MRAAAAAAKTAPEFMLPAARCCQGFLNPHRNFGWK
jgi:hypothetical protein